MSAAHEIEVAEMVGTFYWSPDVIDVFERDEDAVQMVVEFAGVSREKAMGLLVQHSPSERQARQRKVNKVADMVVRGVIDRLGAMNTVIEQTGMSPGWCAAALADAVVERRARQARRGDGTWSA